MYGYFIYTVRGTIKFSIYIGMTQKILKNL